MLYNIHFRFLIDMYSNNAVKKKDKLISKIEEPVQDWIHCTDTYDDGDDYIIECDAQIELFPDSHTDTEDQINKALIDLISTSLKSSERIEYIFIEGIDNGFYWEP